LCFFEALAKTPYKEYIILHNLRFLDTKFFPHLKHHVRAFIYGSCLQLPSLVATKAMIRSNACEATSESVSNTAAIYSQSFGVSVYVIGQKDHGRSSFFKLFLSHTE
jgi:hypothetical protein